MEQKFAQMIWTLAPVPSGDLVTECEQAFQWKKSTTYTMLKRLCDRNLFVNQNGMVTVVTTQAEFETLQGEVFLEETFAGSLPRFLTAFTRRKTLSEGEIAQLKEMIAQYEEGV